MKKTYKRYFDLQVYKEREVYVKEWRKRKRLVMQILKKMATILVFPTHCVLSLGSIRHPI